LNRTLNSTSESTAIRELITNAIFDLINKKYNSNFYKLLSELIKWLPPQERIISELKNSEQYCLEFFWHFFNGFSLNEESIGSGETHYYFSDLDSNENIRMEQVACFIKPLFHPLMPQLLSASESGEQVGEMKDTIRYRMVRQMIEFSMLLNGKNKAMASPGAARIWNSFLRVWVSHLKKNQLAHVFIRIADEYVQYYRYLLYKNKEKKRHKLIETRFETANEVRHQLHDLL
jgi:hypothetical protein